MFKHTPLECSLCSVTGTSARQRGQRQSPGGISARGGVRQYVWMASSQPSHNSISSSLSPAWHTSQKYWSACSHTHRHISEALVHWHSIHIQIQNQHCLTFSTFRFLDLNARYQCPYLLTNFDLRTNFISCHWTSLPCWQLGAVLLLTSYQWPLILMYSVDPVSLELLPFHFVAAIPIVEPVVEKCFQFKFNFFLRCNDLCFFLLQ